MHRRVSERMQSWRSAIVLRPAGEVNGITSPVQQSPCADCDARQCGICAALSDTELDLLGRLSRHRTVRAGDTVVTEGQPGAFGIVTAGALIEQKSLPDGTDQIVSLLFAGDLIAPADNATADATVIAVTDGALCTFERDAFALALDQFPALKTAFMTHLRQELLAARNWMVLLSRKTAQQRLATLLWRLGERASAAACPANGPSEVRDGTEFDIPVSRAQIGSYLGLTVETVSRRLTELREMGAIELPTKRTCRVLSAAQLHAAMD